MTTPNTYSYSVLEMARRLVADDAEGATYMEHSEVELSKALLSLAEDAGAMRDALITVANVCSGHAKDIALAALRSYDTLRSATRSSVSIRQRIEELIDQHGGLRRAARAIGLDAPYLTRLRSGEKDSPSAWALRKMGLERVVTYRRAA